MRIPFSNWQPDQQGLANKGQQDTRNVYPNGGSGYSPVKGTFDLSTTGLAAQCRGAFSGQGVTGQASSFAGDESALYQLSAGVYSDVSKVGGYTLGDDEQWEFTQFGERTIAVQIGTDPQYFDIGSSSTFDDLPGSPPLARHCAVVRDFVVLGNTDTSPNEVVWSGFNNSGQWTAGTNQSDAETLEDGGPIHRIIGGEVGVIFQQRAITRMSYVGPPLIFQFDQVEQARGLLTPGAIATVGNVSFFRSKDGFYSFDPVNGSVPIGHQKVDRWFEQHLQSDTLSLISAAVDPARKLVAFSFVSTDATDVSKPDTILFYHWASKEWAYAKIPHEFVSTALSTGFTLEQIGAIYATLEDVPLSLDDPIWAGGDEFFAVFTTDHQVAALNGETLEATMETADFEGVQGRRSLITNSRPLCDTEDATIVVRSRERFADSVVNTNVAPMQPNGDCPLLSEGRYHRAQTIIPAGSSWTYATGLDIDAQDAGEQ